MAIRRNTFYLLGLYFLVLATIQAQPKSIPRRVLILDFVNQQKNVNADYLSVSIAEALVDPLKKTRKFEILPRSIASKILKEQKIAPNETFNEDVAIQIGIAADADVVVIGNFVAIEPAVQILAKAVDVGEKRLALSKARTAKLDATIFDNINALAGDMTKEMAEKLPPLAQRVIVRTIGGEAPVVSQLWRSAILPGWGQLYVGKKRGWIYMLGYLGALGFGTVSYISYEGKKNSYLALEAGLDPAVYAAARQTADDKRQTALIGFAAAAGIWIFALGDTLLFSFVFDAPTNSGVMRFELGRMVW